MSRRRWCDPLKRDEKQDVAALASWAVIASVVLNHDETVTRG
jgi:hypothetical protein